jgi:phosphate uptake regulator
MKRKVNRVGVNTLTVSLPSDWCKRYGIKKGDELDFLMKEKTIMISPETQKAVGEIRLKIDNPQVFLKRIIHTPYILGYDTIIVEYKDRTVANLVRESLKYLMGFELVEETDDYCTIKNVAKGIEEEFETIFDAQLKILMQIYLELEEALKEKNMSKIKHIRDRDDQFSRFYVFSKRMLNKIGYKDDIKSKAIYAFCTLLEMASDALRNIGEYLLKKPQCINKAIVDVFVKSKEHMVLFMSIFRKYDSYKLFELKKIRNEIFDKIDSLITEQSIGNPILLQIYLLTNAIHHTMTEI